ncbi:hypothetical protein [Maribacter sp. Asnod1-A12]|uniref:hypothetical protein n=1 Tax=Maribacter sp. Asnod1-A12 TaxID=3160576 RepID=UPI00386C5A7C
MTNLKIVFICGSIEPGRDGVGDYTRRLAGEVIRQGNEASIISINDSFSTTVNSNTQIDDDITITVYRLPKTLSRNKRFQQLHTWIQQLDPNWLSLQFVAYSFHDKGLPFLLGKNLSQISKERNWHIMFHELWVGLANDEKIKYRIMGGVQKKIIAHLITKLSPKVIHTQTELYKREIGYIGYTSKLLSLPSNIPITSKITNTTNTIAMVIFGSIYPNAPYQIFAKEVATYLKETKQKATLTLIGRNGHEKNNWVSAFKSNNIPVTVLGEQSVSSISNVLSNSTLGVITTPAYLLEKSGSAAALRLHQLPIINVAKSWVPKRYFKYDAQNDVLVYSSGNFSAIKNLNTSKGETNSIHKVAENFISSLNVIKSN